MRVEFDINKAVDLPKTDSVGQPDPYVIIKIADQERRSTVKKGTTVQWIETLVFEDVPHVPAAEIIVMDKDRGSHDDVMGEATFLFNRVGKDKLFAGDVPLIYKGQQKGVLTLVCRLTP